MKRTAGVGSTPDGALFVSSLNWAKKHKRDGFDGIVSIADPDRRRWLEFHNGPGPEMLRLRFGDMDRDAPLPWGSHPGLRTATSEQVEKALGFARGRSRLLVHCKAGVSRSTALALGILSDRMGPGREKEAVETLFASVPIAVPNLLVVHLSDGVLGRGGALLDALLEYEAEHLRGNDDLRLEGWKAHAVYAGMPRELAMRGPPDHDGAVRWGRTFRQRLDRGAIVPPADEAEPGSRL